MIKWGLCVFLLAMGCSSGDDVKIDWTVSFTDMSGKNLGVVESGSFTTIQSSAPSKMLQGSMATLDIKSDMNGLYFTIIDEDMNRKGAVTCTAQSGSGSVKANANMVNGGHYLITVNAKGARCIAVQ